MFQWWQLEFHQHPQTPHAVREQDVQTQREGERGRDETFWIIEYLLHPTAVWAPSLAATLKHQNECSTDKVWNRLGLHMQMPPSLLQVCLSALDFKGSLNISVLSFSSHTLLLCKKKSCSTKRGLDGVMPWLTVRREVKQSSPEEHLEL